MTPSHPALLAKKNHYLPEDLDVNWEKLSVFFEELAARSITSLDALVKWLADRSELEAFLEEDFAWRYIRMTTDVANEKYQKDFEFFTTEIEPKVAPFADTLNKKFIALPFINQLDEDYLIYKKKIQRHIELFRNENIPIQTELQIMQQKYGSIAGAMGVEVDGHLYTMQQAANFLKEPDRNKRKLVYEKITDRRLLDSVPLDDLMSQLIALRHQVALNAGFTNFKDYAFAELCRFDYDDQDALAFHDAIEKEIVPLVRRIVERRQDLLGLSPLKPWDMDVDLEGRSQLKPFDNGAELIEKSISCFEKLDPYFGECLQRMREHHLFDVKSRMGKAPGGYNYPLAVTGAPFIFMNSAGSFGDLVTMVHEGGHAVHTFLSNSLAINDFKHAPSEIAELASMSMELISMKHWDVFFSHEDELKRARRDQLIGVIKTLPWVAIIDSFQHWLYLNPEHNIEERKHAWLICYERFGGGFTDWEGYEPFKAMIWQQQLHIFEVPFYYIEYAIAGLGAIALWKNFKEDEATAIKRYKEALALGYTRPIKTVYETAGIKFDFSRDHIRALAQFIEEELSAVW